MVGLADGDGLTVGVAVGTEVGPLTNGSSGGMIGIKNATDQNTKPKPAVMAKAAQLRAALRVRVKFSSACYGDGWSQKTQHLPR